MSKIRQLKLWTQFMLNRTPTAKIQLFLFSSIFKVEWEIRASIIHHIYVLVYCRHLNIVTMDKVAVGPVIPCARATCGPASVANPDVGELALHLSWAPRNHAKHFPSKGGTADVQGASFTV